MSKHNLGQFFSTNVDTILEGMKIPENAVVIEPFAGNKDMVKWSGLTAVEMYDIDPRHDDIKKCDTLMNPPNYRGKFVLTNPPYRSRANNPDKTIYDKYKVVDLFYAFLRTIEEVSGGIVILPLIFFTAQKSMFTEGRDHFMSRFKITRVNYFEKQVFDDTTTTIVSFQFEKSPILLENQEIEWFIYNEDIVKKKFVHTKEHGWLVGGELFNLPVSNTIQVRRHRHPYEQNEFLSNITLQALDYNNKRICARYEEDQTHKSKKSPGAYHTFEFDPPLSIENQKKLVEKFNNFLNDQREQHHSLFMAMYREKTRRRLCLTLAIRIIGHILLIHPELHE